MLNFEEASNQVQAGILRPVYLLCGSENLLIDEFISVLKRLLVTPEAGSLNYQAFDAGEVDLVEVLDLARTPPFFGQKRLLVVRNSTRFSPAPGSGERAQGEADQNDREEKALLAYLASPSPSTCLVFTSKTKVDGRKKTVKAFVSLGGAVDCSLPRGNLQPWVQSRARSYGLTLKPEALALLAGMADGASLGIVDSELAKLACYLGERSEVTAEDVAQISAAGIYEDVFSLVDAIGERRPQEAVRLVETLFHRGEPPIRLLFLIARQIRLIWQARFLKEEGARINEIARRLGVHPYVARKSMEQAKNFSSGELLKSLELLLEADLNIKRGIWAPRTALELLACRLAGLSLES